MTTGNIDTPQLSGLDPSSRAPELLLGSDALMKLADLPQLYHARDASEDTSPWAVSSEVKGREYGNVYNGVFYMTPSLEDANKHLQTVKADMPTIHKMTTTDENALVVTGILRAEDTKKLQIRVTEDTPAITELEQNALKAIMEADKAEYIPSGSPYANPGLIDKFAVKTLPAGAEPREWQRAVEKFLSALNSRTLLSVGGPAVIGAILTDPIQYVPISQKPDGSIHQEWIIFNSEYLKTALSKVGIVGVQSTIDLHGINQLDPEMKKALGGGVYFKDAVMLWDIKAIQTEGLVDLDTGELVDDTTRDIIHDVGAAATVKTMNDNT